MYHSIPQQYHILQIIVKLPAAVAIWLICQHLIVYRFKPPLSSVLSFIFSKTLIYIVNCNKNFYFKKKIDKKKSAMESGD